MQPLLVWAFLFEIFEYDFFLSFYLSLFIEINLDK